MNIFRNVIFFLRKLLFFHKSISVSDVHRSSPSRPVQKSSWQMAREHLSHLCLAELKTVQLLVSLEAGSEDGQAEILLDLSAISGEVELRHNDSGELEFQLTNRNYYF